MIGEFNKQNNFELLLDDYYEIGNNNKATMIVIEPHIMIPVTTIVKAFPCARKAHLGNQFNSLNNNVNYALVLGNVIHAIFQSILQCLDFRQTKIDEIIQ